MSASQASSGPKHDAIARAMRTRTVLVRVLSTLMIVLYFAFMSLFAFDKRLLGIELARGLTLCLLIGPGLILIAIVISFAFVLWANLVFDVAMTAASECAPTNEKWKNP